MPPCLLFPRLMVEFCSETERTTLSFFTNCITLSMTCRLYCCAAAADLEESTSANRLSCNSSSEARNTEKSFFIRIGSFLMSGGGWSDGTAPFACQTRAFADAFVGLLWMFLSIMQSLLPKRIPYFFLPSQLLWYTFFIFIADVKSCCCFAETSVKIYDIFWEEPSAILHFSGRKTLCFPHTALFRQEKWHDTS